MIEDLKRLLEKNPGIGSALLKIGEAFLKHEDPVREAERQAAIIAGEAAILAPFYGDKDRT
jgi:hypothetical protein